MSEVQAYTVHLRVITVSAFCFGELSVQLNNFC